MEIQITREKQEEYLRLMLDETIPEIIEREVGTAADGWESFADDVDGIRVESIKPGQGQPGIVRGVTSLDFSLDELLTQTLIVRNSHDLGMQMKHMDATCLSYDLVKELESPANTCLRLVHPVYQCPGPIWDRDFCGIQYLAIITDENTGERAWICAVTSVDDENVPPTEGRVRATFRSSGFIVREPKNPEEDLRVTYIVQCNLGGAINPSIVHQMGSIQCRVAGRMRDNSLACKSAARLMNMSFPFPVKYPRPNNRVEWIVDGTTQTEPFMADIMCVGDMDFWLEISGMTAVEGLGSGFRGRVLLKGWTTKEFSIKADAGARVKLTFHNPNWIQDGRSFVKWQIRERKRADSKIAVTMTTPEMVAVGNQAVETIMRSKVREPTPKERDELEKLQGKTQKIQEQWGNFWNNVFVTQADPSLDETQQIQLWERIHKAIKEHQAENDFSEEKDPLRIADQWTNFWNIVLLQQGHNLDEEEQRQNFWQRTSIAVRQNQELMRQGWQQWQESKETKEDGMNDEDRVSLWDRIQQAIKEHKEAKRLQQEVESKEEEGPTLWQKINGVIQDYQEEHKQGKPMDPQNLQQLWEQINIVLKEERTPSKRSPRARIRLSEDEAPRTKLHRGESQYLPDLRRQVSASEVRISDKGNLESASERMNVWQWVNDMFINKNNADSVWHAESETSSQSSFEVTSVVESETMKRKPSVWVKVESAWDRATREIRAYTEERQRERSTFGSENISMVSEIPDNKNIWEQLQENADKFVEQTQKNFSSFKSSLENMQKRRNSEIKKVASFNSVFGEADADVFRRPYDFDGSVEDMGDSNYTRPSREETFFVSSRGNSFGSTSSISGPLTNFDVREYVSDVECKSETRRGSSLSDSELLNSDSIHNLVRFGDLEIKIVDENNASTISSKRKDVSKPDPDASKV